MRWPIPLSMCAPALLVGCGLVLDLDPQPAAFDAAVSDAAPGFDAAGRDAAPPDAAQGDAARPDAETTAPDGCLSFEACNGVDDDCDGATDEDFDLSSDPAHCGECDSPCPAGVNGAARCVDASCTLACAPGWANCDGDLSSGCESDLTSPVTCGSCDLTCEATRECRSSGGIYACVERCPTGTTRCDGVCVDTSSNPEHCGGCGRACFSDPHGTLGCAMGGCVVLGCGDWHLDCNRDPADGCELDVASDDRNCGSCGALCPSGQTCAGGTCVATP